MQKFKILRICGTGRESNFDGQPTNVYKSLLAQCHAHDPQYNRHTMIIIAATQLLQII